LFGGELGLLGNAFWIWWERVSLLPGPSSTELAIYQVRAGLPGLLVAGTAFLLKTWPLAVSSVAVMALAAVHVPALLLLMGAGATWMLLREERRLSVRAAFAVPMSTAWAMAPSASISVGIVPVFLYFLKVGAVLFGSGYVLLALLRADLVVRLHWLTEAQLLDAMAFSQATPGPFFTVATFIGYVLGGWKAAALATLGMFLPAFVLVAATAKFLSKLRQSPLASALLDGVNAAAVALMALVG
jgi:chromate transporter